MAKGLSVALSVAHAIVSLAILGISIGVLIVALQIKDDYESTPSYPSDPTTPTVPVTVVTTTTHQPDNENTAQTSLCPSIAPSSSPQSSSSSPTTVPSSTKSTTPEATEATDSTAAPEPESNIPDEPVVPITDDRHDDFAKISSRLQAWIDTSIDPCNDFYHYACGLGQANKEQSPFTVSGAKDSQIISAMFKQNQSYFDAAPLPVQQAKWFYDRCIHDDSYTQADVDAKAVSKINALFDYTQVSFPMLHPDDDLSLTPTSLATLLGYAGGEIGSDSLYPASIDVDWKNPDTPPYLFYVDQPQQMFISAAFDKPLLVQLMINNVVSTMNQIADLYGMKLDQTKLKASAKDIVDFDKLIASDDYHTDDITRRDMERSYNKYTLSTLNSEEDQLDWVQFITSSLVRVADRVNVNDTWNVIIMETEVNKKLNDLIKDTNPETIANYIYFRAINQILSSIPAPDAAAEKEDPLAKHRHVPKDRKRMHIEEIHSLRKPEPKPQTRMTASGCANIVANVLPWAGSRMYVDTDIPNVEDRKALKEGVTEIANWIFFGFRSQLDQLNWMSTESKTGAFNKLNNIQLNVAYPDWVTDDDKLSAFYKDLDIQSTDNYMIMREKLSNFYLDKSAARIPDSPPRDRGDFGSFVGITNAWYQPQMNSITFPEGILQEPFYTSNYPLAAIFGSLGVISGHELTHGFDDEGVQWDGVGGLNNWMDNTSTTSFNAMAQCVIDQYSAYCPYEGVCLNGANTQGENIADNGGMQAAFKAFKAYESLNGGDPRLPGFGSMYNSEQLFFLMFGNVWCDMEYTKEMYEQEIAVDVHSPPLYRVLGSLQNFPAFRNAFNCPIDDLYTPTKHCDVWTSRPF